MKHHEKPSLAPTADSPTRADESRVKEQSERERSKLFARAALLELPSMEEWLGAAHRTPEEISSVIRLRAELCAMAIYGWESTVEFVSVDGVLQTVNGMPFQDWYALESAYQAMVGN